MGLFYAENRAIFWYNKSNNGWEWPRRRGIISVPMQ